MSNKAIKVMLLLGVFLALALVISACQQNTPLPTSAPPPACPTAPACPAPPTPAPTATPLAVAPNMDAWAASPHNDVKAEAFNHWNDADPKEIPTSCAECHSTTGFQDFLGADGSAAGKVDKAAPVGETITCAACHNSVTANFALTSVSFNNGVTINGLGPEAVCMNCHQGRATQKTVDDQIAKFNATDPDTVVAPLKNADGTTTSFSFINVHYFAAALTLYGSEVNGGYQYPGQTYDYKNDHVTGVDSCVACHDPHTTEVQVTKCAECHTNVKTAADLVNIREISSQVDYNGNGNITEGIAAEVQGLQDALYKAVQAYATEVAKMGIVYDASTNPYFFQDQNGDGKADVDSNNSPIRYANWTPRLLEAAYNLQMSVKDPGAFAHGPKYTIQLLYDSTADLNTKLTAKIDMSKMHRNDAAHFAGDTQPFRDWDAEGMVPASCAKCHSAGGLPEFLANAGTLVVDSKGVLNVTGVVEQPVANGFQCSTCHDEANFPNRLAVVNVPFPSNVSLTFSTQKDDKGNLIAVDSNLCLECHQGRESTLTVNQRLAAFTNLDKPDSKISFRNVHYLAAGATLFGTNAKGAYEYTGKTYDGQLVHVANFNQCTQCHDAHTLEIKVDACNGCHGTTDPTKIRMTKEDYDGSKDPTEPMATVVDNFKARLYAAIQKYAKDVAGAGIIYDPSAYPYVYLDKNNDGVPDVNDQGAKIGYNAFTPRLLKAVYNLNYATKDPGVFAHNPKYILEVMYDSIQDLNGDLSGLTRPVPTPATQ
jgi:hypothetical protein